MNKTFSLLFYLKTSKAKKDGSTPIYLRITIDGARADISTKRYVNSARWNSSAHKVVGNSEEIRNLNHYLKALEQNAFNSYRILLEKNDHVTALQLKNNLLNIGDEKPQSVFVLNVFKEHNRKVKALVGHDFALGTLERYEVSLRHTAEFIKWKYDLEDFPVNNIDHDFISSYDFYLRTERKCANNSTIKYLKNFKKIILICIANGWIDKDPFLNYKFKLKEVIREFLDIDEVQRIADKHFAMERLNQVRDIFLFCCFTGLAYADVKKLSTKEVLTDNSGNQWINTHRQKTKTVVRIPLLDGALSIIEKYKDHPVCNKGNLLPVLSNQKMNSYLKEISTACGIQKELTFHIARHTFATTITLSNGVSIESVSKMLGHTNIKTTQHYAKILDLKVSQDMFALKGRLKNLHL